MSLPLLRRRDLEFLLHDWLKVSDLSKVPRFHAHSRDTFDAALDLAEDLARREFRTHNRASDLNEPRFDGTRVHMIPEVGRALAAFASSGLLAGSFDEDLGGIQLPHVVNRACFAYFQAANIATASYAMLTMANASLLVEHGSPDQLRDYVIPMLEGRFFGTMCLSEPHAGSSLADVATRARGDGGDRYRLFGQKMWISGGDHELGENIVHLVLARVDGAAPGVKGLSLFIVPKFLSTEVGESEDERDRNDVALVGLNHKMGYRGITNTLLSFGGGAFEPSGQAGAIGYLVGEENRGLEYMFHMMNEARIGVGAGAAALACTGYVQALEYARSRPQGRRQGHKDPAAPQVPIIEHADVRRMLLASKAYAEGAMALVLYAAKLLDDSCTPVDPAAQADAGRLLDVLTPIVKSWPSQWCLQANDLAIQIHGGAGYTRDHDVEQFYRDNRLNLIHEGTQGIQALDLLGRKVVMDGGAGLDLLVTRMREAIDSAPDSLMPWARQLSSRVDRLASVTTALWHDGDAERALANAVPYLEAVGHVVIAWMWLEQAGVAAGKADEADEGDGFYAGKIAAARYFFTYELPKVDAQFSLLADRDTLVLDLDPNTL